MSNSEEEEIARDYICFGNPNATVIILDTTNLERNLNLVYQTMEITNNIIVCVNLLDEAKKKGISINFDLLENLLGVPVVGVTAKKVKTLDKLMKKIYEVCTRKIVPNPKRLIYSSNIESYIANIEDDVNSLLSNDRKFLSRWIVLKLLDRNDKIISSIEKNLNINLTKNSLLDTKLYNIYSLIDKDTFKDEIVSTIVFKCEILANDVCTFKNENYNQRDRKIDKILTSKKFGIPIMLVFLGFIFWLTIVGANYPSQLLSNFFEFLQEKIVWILTIINTPDWLNSILIDGVYTTLTSVIAVMLPPMAIFFPLFTILEDLGYLPRIAFNLDSCFKKACSSR